MVRRSLSLRCRHNVRGITFPSAQLLPRSDYVAEAHLFFLQLRNLSSYEYKFRLKVGEKVAEAHFFFLQLRNLLGYEYKFHL